jgi:hypothetical protein
MESHDSDSDALCGKQGVDHMTNEQHDTSHVFSDHEQERVIRNEINRPDGQRNRQRHTNGSRCSSCFSSFLVHFNKRLVENGGDIQPMNRPSVKDPPLS